MAELTAVLGVPITEIPEPLRSALQATVRGWPPDGLASACLDVASAWVAAHQRRYGHRPGAHCTARCRA